MHVLIMKTAGYVFCFRWMPFTCFQFLWFLWNE